MKQSVILERKIGQALSLWLLLTAISCSTNNPVNQPPLNGKIGGEDWKYKFAKANFNLATNVFEVTMYGTQQTQSYPCSIGLTNEAYLSLNLPPTVSNLSIPSDVSVTFGLKGVTNKTYQATGGFVDITIASQSQIVGYLNAEYDDGNTVSGTFSFGRCN